MYNDERNKTLSELRKQTLFRRFAFILLFVILAGSLAGVGSLLFSNSSITDETGRGEAEVEVAAITGSGTQASPWLVGTAADLRTWGANTSYQVAGTYTKLTADINLAGQNWTPVTSAACDFNGNNYLILNMTVSVSSGYAGFIGQTTAGFYIHDVGFANINVTNTGTNNTAGIVAYDQGGKYKNCFVTGKISGTGGYTAGIVAASISSGIKQFENCFNAANVSGGSPTGGIHGQGAGTLINCYNVGTVSGSSGTGGISQYPYSNITNSYNAGIATNGIKGTNGNASTATCFNNSSIVSAAGGGTNRTTAQMTNDNVLTTTTANGGMSELLSDVGAGQWVKRKNDSTTDLSKMYYPELKVFSENPNAVIREYSKASVRASGFVDPGYMRNEAPTCTANTAVTDVPWIGNDTKRA